MGADFAQNAALVAVAIVTALIGVLKYIKTEGSKEKPAITNTESSVMAASFIDSRVLRDLIEAVRIQTEEYSRETRKINRSRQELATALEESTDALLANTDAMINMTRFLKKDSVRSQADE